MDKSAHSQCPHITEDRSSLLGLFSCLICFSWLVCCAKNLSQGLEHRGKCSTTELHFNSSWAITKLFWLLYLFIFVYVYTCIPWHICRDRRMLVEVSSLFPSCEFQGSDLSASSSTLYLPTELSCQSGHFYRTLKPIHKPCLSSHKKRGFQA